MTPYHERIQFYFGINYWKNNRLSENSKETENSDILIYNQLMKTTNMTLLHSIKNEKKFQPFKGYKKRKLLDEETTWGFPDPLDSLDGPKVRLTGQMLFITYNFPYVFYEV